MKKAELIRKLRAIARAHNLELIKKEGGDHEKWFAGTFRVIVPRHKETAEHLARSIIKDMKQGLHRYTDERKGEE